MSFFVLALVFGGYFGATVLTTLAGAAPPTLRGGERRVIALFIYAIVTGVLTTLVAGLALGHFEGHRLALAGLAVLVVFAVASAVAALQIAIGILGSLVAMMVILWLGSQSSGGLASWEFLPLVTRSVGPYLPAGAGLDAVRNVLYFGGNSIARNLIVLACYAVVGSTVVLLVGRRHGLKLPNEAELAPATTLS